jgi:hypothetical protein
VNNIPRITTPNSRTARLLAVEVLLADPETLADDVLESCLYLMKERLQSEDMNQSDSA